MQGRHYLILQTYPRSYSEKVKGRELNPQNQATAGPVRPIVTNRRHPRFKLEVDIAIYSRSCGLLKGHTVDISESGVSAVLRMESPVGEIVELNFALPLGPVTIHAIARQRNAFRYGFEFLGSNAEYEIIRLTCRNLALEQSLMSPIASDANSP